MSAPKRRRIPGLENVPESIQVALAEHYNLPRQLTDEIGNFVEVEVLAQLAAEYLIGKPETKVASIRYSLQFDEPTPGGTLFAVSTIDRLYLQAVPDDGSILPLHEFNTREPGNYGADREAFWVEHFGDGIHVATRALKTPWHGVGVDLAVHDWVAGVFCVYNLFAHLNTWRENPSASSKAAWAFADFLREAIFRLPVDAADPLDETYRLDLPDPRMMAPVVNSAMLLANEGKMDERSCMRLQIPLYDVGDQTTSATLVSNSHIRLQYELSARQETVRCPDGQDRRIDVIRLAREHSVGPDASFIPFAEADVYVDTTRPTEPATLWIRVIKPAPAQAKSNEDAAYEAYVPTGEPFEAPREVWVGMLRAIYLSSVGRA
jgi:hypothetical protein